MLDYGECSEAVILQLENPVGIVECSVPLQERHWLEIGMHAETLTIAGARRFNPASGFLGSVPNLATCGHFRFPCCPPRIHRCAKRRSGHPIRWISACCRQ